MFEEDTTIPEERQLLLDLDLLDAIKDNDINSVKGALERGANVNAWEIDGSAAAIHLATNLTYILPHNEASHAQEITQELCNRDVNVNVITKEGFTPLLLAARSGDEDVLDVILAYGAAELDPKSSRFVDLDAVTHEMNHNAIHLAAIEGHEDIIETLIEAGTDFGAVDVNKETASNLARENGHEDLALILDDGEETATKIYASEEEIDSPNNSVSNPEGEPALKRTRHI